MNYKKTVPTLFIFFFIIAIASFLSSCKENELSEEEEQQALIESQLRNTYENGILPLLDSFIARTTSLNEAVVNFSENKTESQLVNTQREWFETLSVWKNIELYNLGDIQDSFLHFQINRWPSNTDFIEDFISDDDLISEDFIAGKGASSKGISGAEYLLYSEATATETLTTFISAENAERRTSYLVAITEDLMSQSQRLKDLWEVYAPTFYSTFGSSTSGSQNQLANEMIALSEQIVILKLGKPLGEQSGGNIDITDLENFRSEVSIESIEQNVRSLYNVYTGDYNNDESSIGFDDILLSVDADAIDEAIRENFEENLSAINNIQGSLVNVLETNPQQVIELQSSLNELEVLIKVDMSNAIGIIVTVNSNDGD